MKTETFEITIGGENPLILPSFGKTCREFDQTLKRFKGQGVRVTAWRVAEDGKRTKIVEERL